MAKPITQDQDSGNFFKASTYNEAYWDNYMAAGAKYSSDFYDRIFTYHEIRNPSQTKGVAHDIGTGPGQVATELCKHFDKVFASDPNSTHLAVAARCLEKAGLKDRVIWTESRAEYLSSKYPPGSASLLTVAECLPLLNVPRAMNTFAHLLQPDGTLAIWLYGRPAFSEPKFAAICQPILNDISDLTVAKVIKGGNNVHKAAWKSARTLWKAGLITWPCPLTSGVISIAINGTRIFRCRLLDPMSNIMIIKVIQTFSFCSRSAGQLLQHPMHAITLSSPLRM